MTNEGSSHSSWNTTTPDDGSSHYFVGDAPPAVPPKLVERIKSKAFIEMSDLSPERFGQVALEDDPNQSLDIAQYLTLLNGYSVLRSILL